MSCYIRIDDNKIDLYNNETKTISELILYQNKEYNLKFYIEEENVEDVKLNIGGIEFSNSIFNPNNKNEYTFGIKRFFSCMWGYAQIVVIVKFFNKEVKNYYYSKLINVYLDSIKDSNYIKSSVEKMISYVIDNNQVILQYLSREKYTLINQNIYKTLMTEIKLLKDIIECYDKNYSYFMRDLKYKLITEVEVDDFNKIKKITPDTIKYISKNPYELQSVNYNTGINILKRNFKPNNVMMCKSKEDYNIYENQVIIGFIMTLISYTEKEINKINEKIKSKKYNSLNRTIFFFYDVYLNELKNILPALEEMYCKYRRIIRCNHYILEERPISTSILLRGGHYREVFINIEKWFDKSNYKFDDDKDLITTFQTADQIYEYYCLIKLIKVIQSTGFENKVSEFFKYDNCDYTYEYNNTFEFYRNNNIEKITLYYQPVIYSYQMKNDITLYRTNGRNTYYIPDYLIKIEIEDKIKYIILDAKWQTLNTIKNYTLNEIMRKYVMSIDDYYGNKIDAVILLQGRNDNTIKYEYKDSELSKEAKVFNVPKLDILCLTPETDSSNTIRSKINNLIENVK